MATRLISEQYLAEQKHLHISGDYGRAGAKWIETVVELFSVTSARDVLDYGCGKGFLGVALDERGIVCMDYDPAIPGKTHAPRADLVVCTDVMEHIEPDRLDEVIRHLIEVTKIALFVAISTRPAGKRLTDGRNAHLIIQPNVWWRQNFESKGFKVKREWSSQEQEWVALLKPPPRRENARAI